jgi:meso-butanediol dehydrogenase/(S,S)-butanediol dehydrogenase/diacetyl reductase
MRFENKTVIITGGAGGTGGTGLAIASRFASEGANIVLADINMEHLQQAAETLNTKNIWLSQCDVSSENQLSWF